jgi:hypothetical protein
MTTSDFPASARPAVAWPAVTDRTVFVAVSGGFVLPSILFASALRPMPGLLVLAGCLAALALIAGRSETGPLAAPLRARRLCGCIAFAVAILLLGGETHLFYPTRDWQIRDAVLADLVQFGFPAVYTINGGDYLLRAPLGMYLLPALVGQGLGLLAAHVAMLVQNALLLGATFYLLMTMGRGWPHVLIMVGFAGLTIVTTVLSLTLGPPRDALHWARHTIDSWNIFFEYSGSVVQFFWVPNHALPGWWLATLMILQRRGGIDVAVLGVSVAILLLWSPLAILGVLPWLVWLAVTEWRSVVLSRRTWAGAAAGVCFLPVAVYLVLGLEGIRRINEAPSEPELFWIVYVMFMLIQLPAAWVVLLGWRDVPREVRSLVAACIAMLVVLPFLSFGPSNDLVMRGSIPALTVLAFVFADSVVRNAGTRTGRGLLLVAITVLMLPSAMVEIGRAVLVPSYPISDCTLHEATIETGFTGVPGAYVAPVSQVPGWLMATDGRPAVAARVRTCWPDLPNTAPPPRPSATPAPGS